MGTRAKPRKAGRPRLNPDEVKSKTIQFRVSSTEHQALCEGAEAAGESLSAWLLKLGLKAAKKAQRRG